MQYSQKINSARFLEHQLQEVITLLEKQQLENHWFKEALEPITNWLRRCCKISTQAVFRKKFALLHPADIAFILESLPLNQRKTLWDAI